MPNPKRKHTRSRTGMRRASNWTLETGGMSGCTQCGKLRSPHRICPHCGFYNGKLVLPKREKKHKGPQSAEGGEEGKSS